MPPSAEHLRKILVIDDNLESLRTLDEALSTRYQVRTSSDPVQGVEMAEAAPPDLLLVDLDMPGMNGVEVCEAIRASRRTAGIAVIFITSDPQASSMQRALKAGANDYLIKPFRIPDLLNRVEFRLGEIQSNAFQKCGNLVLDPARLTVSQGNQKRQRLSRRAARVLEVFFRNPGGVLSREQLIHLAWDTVEDVSDRAVDLQVFRLRKQLGKLGWNWEIEAVYGQGYALKRHPLSRKKKNPSLGS